MQNKIDIKSMILGAILGAVILLSVGAATSTRTNWEYKVVPGKYFTGDQHLGDAINRNAIEGWDFVSASHGTEQWAFAVLRREKK